MRRRIRAVVLAAGLAAAAAAGAWNPLDNWSVSEEPLAKDEIRLSLHMMRIHSGGAGEARWYFMRRAGELARAAGYDGFAVLSYAEGIDSRLPLAQRYAEGVIRLLPWADPAARN